MKEIQRWLFIPEGGEEAGAKKNLWGERGESVERGGLLMSVRLFCDRRISF